MRFFDRLRSVLRVSDLDGQRGRKSFWLSSQPTTDRRKRTAAYRSRPPAGTNSSTPMDLTAVVKKYLEISGGYNRPVHLSKFGLSKGDTERIFSALDEDYQISRYLLLSREASEALSSYPTDSRVYLINKFEVTHVSFQPDIQKLL